jgi:Holliday junction resolvase RusA-like endonuclease
MIFKCTIPGRVMVKKNQQKVTRFRGITRVRYTARYLRWAEEATVQVLQALKFYQRHGDLREPISEPVNLKVLCYFKDHQAEPDLSALYEGIQDVLQDFGVISDDKLVHGHDGSRKIFGQEPRMEVEVTLMGEK